MRIDDWLMVGLIAVIVVGMFALVKSGDIHSRKKLKSYTAAPTPDWYDYFKDNAPVYLKPQPVGQHMPLDPLLHADPCSHADNGFDDLLPPPRLTTLEEHDYPLNDEGIPVKETYQSEVFALDNPPRKRSIAEIRRIELTEMG